MAAQPEDPNREDGAAPDPDADTLADVNTCPRV